DAVWMGGGVSRPGTELRLGRIRAFRPRVMLVQFADGSWNLPPGINRPARKGGLKVRVDEVVLDRGAFELAGRKMNLSVALQDFVGNLSAIGADHYSGALPSRRMTLRLPDAEPIVSDLSTRFHMEPGRGVVFETVRVNGDFGSLRAAGSIATGGPASTTALC